MYLLNTHNILEIYVFFLSLPFSPLLFRMKSTKWWENKSAVFVGVVIAGTYFLCFEVLMTIIFIYIVQIDIIWGESPRIWPIRSKMQMKLVKQYCWPAQWTYHKTQKCTGSRQYFGAHEKENEKTRIAPSVKHIQIRAPRAHNCFTV